jgi:hypothetical protein
MRKSMLLSILVVAVLALGGAGAAGSSDQGADIFGVGGGHVFDNQFGTFDLSAHSSLTRDFGHVAIHAYRPDVEIYVDIDCVNAIAVAGFGSAAFVAGVVKRVSPVPNFLFAEPGDRQSFLINDGGEPSGSSMVDAFYPVTPHGPPPSCKVIEPYLIVPNVSEGNVNIRLG